MPSRKSSMAQTFYLLLNTPLVEPEQTHKDVALQDMSGSPSSRRSPSERSIDSVSSSLDRPRVGETSESSIQSNASSSS
ncbi:hypothetical protein B0H12DRAFT_1100307 [Mycena haematopus]|nr:hypothetical protein B0H12DRAFT_1100307 [Mycena haematopus]